MVEFTDIEIRMITPGSEVYVISTVEQFEDEYYRIDKVKVDESYISISKQLGTKVEYWFDGFGDSVDEKDVFITFDDALESLGKKMLTDKEV